MMEKIKEMSKLEKVLCVVVCVLVVCVCVSKISKPEEQTTESQYNTETDV